MVGRHPAGAVPVVCGNWSMRTDGVKFYDIPAVFANNLELQLATRAEKVRDLEFKR